MYKITIVNPGLYNTVLTQYCVRAESYQAAGDMALEISGTDNIIKIVDY